MPDLRRHEFRRILLIKPSSLGDVIHALPVLNGLRQRYDRARISWLVNTEYVGLLEDHPQLDEVIPFDRERLKTLRGAAGMTMALGRFARQLRVRRFDLVLDLQGLLRSGLMALASGAPIRVGFSPAREGAGLFYNQRIRVPDPDLHAVDKNYLAAGALGFDDVPIRFHLPVRSGARDTLYRKLTARGADPARGYVAVFPGSRWQTKNWPAERFSAAVDHIHNTLELAAVLCASAAEAELCQSIAHACRTTPPNLAGQLDLPEVVALVDGAAVVLSNDSAPLHIAAALGKPLVSIFGPTNPARTGPYRRQDSVLQAPLDCAPCYFRKLTHCPIQHQCMKDITVPQVTRALQKKLAGAPGENSQPGTVQAS